MSLTAPDAVPPGLELFGSAWAARLERELAGSERYRDAAARWRGALVFQLEPDGSGGFTGRRALFLDLAHGSCRAARPALAGDLAAADFTLSAPAGVWLRLLDGEIEPGSALLGGGLKLVRGSMFSLLPHLAAAKELLECARLVPTAPEALR